ncbi:hypothetical protein C1N86_11655 [Priestia aryabhattai]
MKMRIGIDGRKLSENKTGIGNYLENILEEILNLDQENEYVIFTDKPVNKEFENRNVNYVVINNFKSIIPITQIYRPIWLNILLMKHLKNIDIFWGPDFLSPLGFSGKKTLITIHDLAFIDVNEHHSKFHAMYFKTFLKFNLRKAPNVLTVSQYSKKRILEHYPEVSAEKVNITYCSYNSKQFNIEFDTQHAEKIRKIHQLPRNYMLFVGTTTARKNLVNVVKSIAYLSEKNVDVLDLVVVGARGNGLKELIKLVKELKIDSKIHFLGYVDDCDIPYIYKLADLFLFPSLYEGFGIPLLESMSTSTPIITSSTTSLPEVAGDAAIIVDPYSYTEIGNAIELVLDSSTLKEELRAKMSTQINKFSWQESAKQFLKTLNSLKSITNTGDFK